MERRVRWVCYVCETTGEIDIGSSDPVKTMRKIDEHHRRSSNGCSNKPHQLDKIYDGEVETIQVVAIRERARNYRDVGVFVEIGDMIADNISLLRENQTATWEGMKGGGEDDPH